MPPRAPRAISKPGKKRGSVTDNMHSDAEKILSGVDRQKIKLLDSEENAEELAKYWPEAPAPCVVVVPGSKGHFVCIKHIADRLEATGFVLGLPYPHRPKLPGQQTLRQEAEMKRRQAKQDAALTEEQRERIERNKRQALEKLARRTSA